MGTRIGDVGYWSGLAAVAATTAFVVVQLLQVAGLLRYPLDEILIYTSSLCIVVPFVLEMLAFHHLTEGARRYWTHAALIFTVMYAVFVTANYVVQLATVIPARLGGGGDDVRLLEQTPHSLFWDFDAIGYVSMGLATVVAVPALGGNGFEAWVRRSFIAHAAVTPLIAVVYFAPTFTPQLLFLGLPWAITAPLFMGVLAVLLRRRAASISPQRRTQQGHRGDDPDRHGEPPVAQDPGRDVHAIGSMDIHTATVPITCPRGARESPEKSLKNPVGMPPAS